MQCQHCQACCQPAADANIHQNLHSIPISRDVVPKCGQVGATSQQPHTCIIIGSRKQQASEYSCIAQWFCTRDNLLAPCPGELPEGIQTVTECCVYSSTKAAPTQRDHTYKRALTLETVRLSDHIAL